MQSGEGRSRGRDRTNTGTGTGTTTTRTTHQQKRKINAVAATHIGYESWKRRTHNSSVYNPKRPPLAVD